MATRKQPFEMSAILYSAAGGVAGVMAGNQLRKIEFFQSKPKLVPLATAAAGGALMFFGSNSKAMAGIGAGMIAVSGATLAAEMMQSMNGMSRVNLQGNQYHDPYQEEMEVMNEMQRNADIVNVMEMDEDEYEDEDLEDYDDM